MTFTKNKLSAAMAGAAVGAIAAPAFALDIDPTNNVATQVASETVQTTASALQGTSFGLEGTLTANQIPANTDIRVTVTLSSGTFGAAPTMAITNSAGATNAAAANGACLAASNTAITAACPAFAVFTGGGTADSAVTFNTTTTGTVVQSGAHFDFNLGGAGIVIGTSQAAITADVGIQIADNFGPTTLPGFSAEPVAAFGPVGSLVADPSPEPATRINAASSSLLFSAATNDTAINVGGFRALETTTGEVSLTGTAVGLRDLVANVRPSVIAANGFSAMNQGTAIAGDAITWDNAGADTDCAISTADATLAVCAATYLPAITGDAADRNDFTLSVGGGTANTVRIEETTLVASIASTAANTAAFSNSTLTGTIPLLSLARNGSSARLSFALTPGGSYPMFIRVTNPSAVAGPVTLTLTNDDGLTSSAINLSDIAGAPAGDLGAGASTALLSIDDVMTAVQAADSAFALGAANKLRVDAVAEFGAAGATGVILGAFSVSTDGTTFNMLTDASN